VPIVFRGPNGAAAGVAAQHSQCFGAWYSHCPGLKVRSLNKFLICRFPIECVTWKNYSKEMKYMFNKFSFVIPLPDGLRFTVVCFK
jgi:hypothetical protein